MKKIIFLTLAEVIEIHADQIGHYGGGSGIISKGGTQGQA